MVQPTEESKKNSFDRGEEPGVAFIVLLTLLVFVILACCRRYKSKMKTVKVLTMDGKSDYTIAIRYFARTELNYKFNFVSKYEQSSKYLLLCNVQSRIPDDLEDTIKALGLEGKRLEENILVVAMHSSVGRRQKPLPDIIGTPDDPLYSLQLTNVFYSGKTTLSCPENEKAKHIIADFLR